MEVKDQYHIKDVQVRATQLIQSPYPDVRTTAYTTLWKISGKKPIPELKDGLKDENTNVREKCKLMLEKSK